MSVPEPRQTLNAYASGAAGQVQVMRALTEHDGYYVPADFSVGELGRTVADHAIIFSATCEVAPRQLLIFTDTEAAHRADGERLGLLSSRFTGVEIFSRLSDRYDQLLINPCSPQADTWNFQPDAFEVATIWAQVVDLERSVAGSPEADLPIAKLQAHPGYMILVYASGNVPVFTQFPEIVGPTGIAFTAPDRYEAYRDANPADTEPTRTVTLDGSALFTQLQRVGAAGLLLNPGVPEASCVVPGRLFEAIAHA